MYYSENNTPRRSSERPEQSSISSNRTGHSRNGYSAARPGYTTVAPTRQRTEARAGTTPNRRPTGGNRRFRQKRSSSRPIVMAIAAVLVAGFGIFGAVKLLPMLGGISVSDGTSIASSVPPSVSEPESIDAIAPVTTPEFEVKVAACYSDDAFVVEHLQVPTSVSTPVILASTTAAGNNATYSTEPVAVGSSGRDNIPQWKTKNDHTIAWLRIPGTSIDYPVLQGPSTSFYTEKGYDKKYSKNGVIWAAGNCNFGSSSSDLSFNTTLFGHNWTNYSGTPRVLGPNDVMFAQLTAYHYQWFTQSHPYIWFSTENEDMLWQVFAVFYADTSFRYIDPEGGQAMLDGILARSEFVIDVPVSTSDKLLTLSTCTQRFGPSRQQRFVVCAKLVSGVSDTPASVTANPNPVRPRV